MHIFFKVMIAIVVLLNIPVIVYAANTDAYNSGQTTGQFIFLVLIAWGTYKSFSIARRETTSTKCAIALGLSLVGYFILSIFTIIKPYIASPRAIGMIFVMFAFVFFITSMVLAVLGLIEYSRAFVQGKKQAIWAILINTLFIVAVVWGVFQGVANQTNKQRIDQTDNQRIDQVDIKGPITDSELNFMLEDPGRPYSKIKPKVLNSYAKVALMRSNPQIFYMLIPQRMGIDQQIDTEGLLDIAQAALKNNSKRVTIGKAVNRVINGMNGLYFVADAELKNKEFSYVYWVCARNGFYYQQIAFTQKQNKAALLKDADKIFMKFKQIKPDEVCYSIDSKPFGHYKSDQFGYSIDLSGTPWLKWPELKGTIPGADIGGQTGNGVASFFIEFLPLDQGNPGKDAIIGAFFQSIAIDQKDEKLILISDESNDTFHDYTYKILMQEDGALYDYRINIVIHSNYAFCKAVWSDKGVSTVDVFSKQLNDSITFSEPNLSLEHSRLDEQGLLATADMLNRVGIYFENNEKDAKALEYYALAVTRDPKDEVFWDNAMKIFNTLKKHRRAVSLFKKFDKKVTFSNNILTWYAWHLYQSGNKPEALEKYKQLFAGNYSNEEDFKYYIDLLVDAGAFDDINPAFDLFLKQQKNEALRLYQVKTWHGVKHFEKALAVLETLNQQSTDVILWKISNFQGLERHSEAIQLCDDLIAGNKNPGDGYYFKGKSEYNLKWYTQAKKSFESALEITPGDKSTNRYLKDLSGILGQGDNSTIKTKIHPVPLPEKVQARMVKTPDPKYIDEAGAYYQQYCSGYQWGNDGVLKYTMRHKIHIVNSIGANSFSTYTIGFNPLYEQLYVNSLVVRDKKGTIIATGNDDSFFIVDAQNASQKSHDQILNMPIPQIIPGCTIEIVATKILGNYKKFPFTNRALSTSSPVINGMVYVLGDTDKFNLKAENGAIKESFDIGEMAYIYAPIKYRWEPNQVPYHLMLPFVYVNSNERNWVAEGEDYLKKIQKQLILTDDIKQLSLSLIDKKDTKEIKIAKLYSYLQKNYKYLGIEFGSRGQIPYEASLTVQNRYGDCKDHAVLFHHLLKSAGIESHLALLHTSSAILRDMPSRDQFNHIINFIPGKNPLFLDPTDKEAAMSNTSPAYLAGSQSLIIEPGNVRFLQIPDYKTQESQIRVNREFQIQDKTLKIDETLELVGHPAGFMRSFLKVKNKEAHLAWGQSAVHSYYPSATLKKITIKNLQENEKPLRIDFAYVIPGKIQQINEGIIVNTTSLWEHYYLSSDPVNNRRSDFKIEIPFLFTSNTNIKIPSGFNRSDLQKNVHSKTNFGTFELNYIPNKKSMQYQVSATSQKGVFPKNEYQSFYEFKQRILQDSTPNFTFTKH